ncbi:iron-sulfur cluster binding protein [Halarchaeum acidiphilum MH1-52-1]|uniref:Iron-sulfur cluster binding protein n=2 Tax=Halarchaeum acidiphilum TaxID=489138 RepID=U2YW45_9EURY|nr:lactate racemase domain-containing protein [Halarchaeum acidiphilum]GAD53250.1 iron-sulfur cluster binding protein [Halarchaeum acidiphilum MH1-52-1]
MADRDELAVPEETVVEACGETPLPAMGVIEQVWETDPIPSDELATRAGDAVESLAFEDVPAGGEVAVGAGSRGIANLATIVSAVVTRLEDMGYEPFVFPAMGSHGGATGEGQREMLNELGVSEETVGCEIRSSMDVVRVGETPERGVPVVADANAAAADAILPINRVKPHTDFDGDVESGLSKMMVIGMGKQRGAKIAHEWALNWSFRNMIPEITDRLLDSLPIVGGVALVEDQHDETTIIEGIRPDGFLDREAELLETAYDIMPTLPFDDLDVVVFDEQGKDISGQGMDTNVIGRRPFAINEPEPDLPDIKRIYTRGLTDATHGNAMGVGSADFVHANVAAELASAPTLINAITASTTRGVRLPPVVETDRAGVVAALSTIGVVDPEGVRVLRAPDTMHLGRLYASSALVEAARDRDDLRVVEEPTPMAFEDGAFAAPSLHDDD